jgi:uncharacterized OB-fold protein
MLKQCIAKEEGGVPPWVKHAIIAIAVIAGGYFIYAAWRSSDRQLEATLMCSTQGCGYLRTEALQVGEMLPARCPKCGKDSLLPAFNCPKCKTVNIWNENRGLPPPTKCSKCGQEVRHGT